MKKLLMAGALSAAFIAASAAAEMYIGGGVGKSDTDSAEQKWSTLAGIGVGCAIDRNLGLSVKYSF